MRNLIKRLINWALGYDLSLKISVIESLDTESIARDILDEHSSDFELLNNYDWDDFSQRLDNVQHLEHFSEDDFREQLQESWQAGNQYKPLRDRLDALDILVNHNSTDLKIAQESIEQTDQWFKSFLNATHEHFMRQAGDCD